MALSFVDKIITKKGHLIHKIKGTDTTGKRAYYFVLVEPIKEVGLMKAIQGGSLNLEDYGKIIASCYGEEPTTEIKKMLKEKYGFDA